MNYENAITSLNNDFGVKTLRSLRKLENFYMPVDASLVGGSVVDILEGRKPKDYDVLAVCDFNALHKCGFQFLTETKFATTFIKDNLVFQFLKTSIECFDFTISQSRYYFNTECLHIDEISYEKKLLRPVNFTNRRQIIDSLLRIPHWKRKGYNIDDVSYISLLSSLNKAINLESI
jgi:hypothetical protein